MDGCILGFGMCCAINLVCWAKESLLWEWNLRVVEDFEVRILKNLKHQLRGVVRRVWAPAKNFKTCSRTFEPFRNWIYKLLWILRLEFLEFGESVQGRSQKSPGTPKNFKPCSSGYVVASSSLNLPNSHWSYQFSAMRSIVITTQKYFHSQLTLNAVNCH
jgi:hypothetical protein